MRNVAETDTIFLEQLVYTWAERTLTGTGNGVVLRSHGWPTGNSIAADAALADFVEYLPAKLQHRLGSGRTPPTGADFWHHPEFGHVAAVHRYLGVDSAGRGGRSIVHVFLDRERRLDARLALELCQSPFVASDWALTAEPVHGSDGLRFAAGQQQAPRRRADGDVLPVILAGVLEYLIHGRQIVFTHDHEHDVDALGLLEDCLNILPRALAARVTFSTFRGVPQRSKCAISFASNTFSELLPKADVQKTYVNLYESASGDGSTSQEGQIRQAGFSGAALDLSSALLRLRETGGPAAPAEIGSVHALDQWVSHHELALRPVDSLQLADCEILLALPARTSWVHRGQIIGRAAQLTATAMPVSTSRPSFLGHLDAQEREAFGQALHSIAVAELMSSPDRSLAAKHRAEALGYPGQRLADLAAPVIDSLPVDGRTPNPALGQFIAEIARFVPLQQRFDWVSRAGLQDPLLREWQPTAQAIAKRTWIEPQWAAEHVEAACAVALRHPGSSAEILATALARNEASPRGIDAVLALDEASGGKAFTEVIRRVVALPGIQPHQLRRLTACGQLPSDARSEISAIIDPPIQEEEAAAGDPIVEPVPAQPAPEPLLESAPQDQAWTAAERDLTFAQGSAPLPGHQPAATKQPATARRRTLVRMLAVVLSAAAGYLVAATNWSLLAWPPALFVVVMSLVLMALPIKRKPTATDEGSWRLLPSKLKMFRPKLKGRHQPLKSGSRFSWKARKPRP